MYTIVIIIYNNNNNYYYYYYFYLLRGIFIRYIKTYLMNLKHEATVYTHKLLLDYIQWTEPGLNPGRRALKLIRYHFDQLDRTRPTGPRIWHLHMAGATGGGVDLITA